MVVVFREYLGYSVEMTKRILIFATNYLPNIGGAELAIQAITNRIDPEEMGFDLIVPRLDAALPRKEVVDNVNVYRVGFGMSIDKFLIPVFGLVKALQLHVEHEYDTAWAMMASQASIAAAFFKIWKPKVKLVLTLQEGDTEEHLKRYAFGNETLYKYAIQPWHLLVFKKADVITAISEYLKDRALSYDVACPIHVIPNGVDSKEFSKELTSAQCAALTSKLGKQKDDVILVTTSRLVKKNATEDIIEALTHLPSKVRLLVIGGGPDYKKLKELVQDKKLSNRVQFLGTLQNHELPKYLKVSDIFIRPSLSEGFGISFVEAMAAGLPVVATQVGGIQDFLIDPSQNGRNATGLVVEVHNPEDIAEKVLRLMKDNRLYERLIKNASKLVQKKYDWNLITEQMRKQVFN